MFPPMVAELVVVRVLDCMFPIMFAVLAWTFPPMVASAVVLSVLEDRDPPNVPLYAAATEP